MGAGSIGGGIEWTTLIARPGLWTPGRPVSAPSLVVVHCTQGDSAGGAAQWFTNSAARGSAHVVIDDTSAYRCVNDMDTAYHARSVNSYSLGLEITGYASWTTEQWMEHKPRLMEAARTHAGWNLKYGIPMEWSVTRGYHSHKGLPGNDHTDPGDGFPWDFYVATVKATMAGAVMNPPEFGNTLRIRMPDGRVYGGWIKDEAAYDGPAGGALRWISEQKPKRIKPGTIIWWRGSMFKDEAKLPQVARTIIKRFGGDLYG